MCVCVCVCVCERESVMVHSFVRTHHECVCVCKCVCVCTCTCAYIMSVCVYAHARTHHECVCVRTRPGVCVHCRCVCACCVSVCLRRWLEMRFVCCHPWPGSYMYHAPLWGLCVLPDVTWSSCISSHWFRVLSPNFVNLVLYPLTHKPPILHCIPCVFVLHIM